MSIRAVRQQVVAILDSNGLSWSERGDSYVLRFASAVLSIDFTSVGAQNLLTIRANILREVDPGHKQTAAILSALNGLNCQSHFGKWTLQEGHEAIVLEYDMIADHMQEEELMTALAMLARLADQQEDRLQQRFGGYRAFEDAGK